MSDSESPLIHLIYCSAATEPFDEADLHALLEKARRTNAELNVTGMLLHADGSFFQVLEGDRGVVDRLFERIGRDPRHDRVTIIINEPIERRSFDDWTMGYTNVDARRLSEIPGLNDFFVSGSCFGDIDPGRARKLLRAFEQGRWRATLGQGNRRASSASSKPGR